MANGCRNGLQRYQTAIPKRSPREPKRSTGKPLYEQGKKRVLWSVKAGEESVPWAAGQQCFLSLPLASARVMRAKIDVGHSARYRMMPLISNTITSLTNFSLTASVEIAGGARGLGAFTLVIAPYYVGLTIQRSITSQYFLARKDVGLRDLARLLIIITLVASFISLGIWFWLGSASRPLLGITIGTAPALLQDGYRFRRFGAKRAINALQSDMVWLFTSLSIATISALAVGRIDVRIVSWSWSVGAAVGLGLAAVMLKPWRGSRHLGGLPIKSAYSGKTLLIESLCLIATGQLLVFVVGPLISLTTLGIFSWAQSLTTPVVLVGSSVISYLLPRKPEHVQYQRWARHTVRRLIPLASAMGLLIFIVLAALPRRGLDFIHIQHRGPFLWVLALAIFATILSFRNQILLMVIREVEEPKRWLPRRIGAAIFEPILGISLAPLWGATGIMTALLVYQIVLAGLLRQLGTFRSREPMSLLLPKRRTDDHPAAPPVGGTAG
jgi:hypothetical protein